MMTDHELGAEIDRVLLKAVRQIERERKRLEYACLNPESGTTKTERLLVDAMLGRITLDDLTEAVR